MDAFVKAITAALRLLKQKRVLQACSVAGSTVAGGLMLGPAGAAFAGVGTSVAALMDLPLWLELAPLLLNILYESGSSLYLRAKEYLLDIARIIINVINRHVEEKLSQRAVEYGCKLRDSSPTR